MRHQEVFPRGTRALLYNNNYWSVLEEDTSFSRSGNKFLIDLVSDKCTGWRWRNWTTARVRCRYSCIRVYSFPTYIDVYGWLKHTHCKSSLSKAIVHSTYVCTCIWAYMRRSFQSSTPSCRVFRIHKSGWTYNDYMVLFCLKNNEHIFNHLTQRISARIWEFWS